MLIKSVLLVECQNAVKYQILGYFLNTEYRDQKCHTYRPKLQVHTKKVHWLFP